MKPAAFLVALLAARAAGAQDDARAEARKHATRGTELAGDGDCAAAVREFTAAYRVLKDPAILFNRAECERKLGDGKAAIADYRKFLDDLPNAPNRQSVEDRIAELDRASAPPAPPPAPEPAAPAPSPEAVTVADRATPAEPAPNRMPTWVWVGLGAMVLAGGVVATAFAVGRRHTSVPESSLGNYRF